MFDRILVTGGTGFIGGYVVSKLIAAGHRPQVTFRGDEPTLKNSDPDHIELVRLDITNADQTEGVITSLRPDVVIHLAGVTGHNDPNGELCNAVNVVGTRHLLEASQRIGVKRFIMLGSASEYGDQPTPFREDMTVQPVSPYAVSRAKATTLALQFSERGLPVTVLRVFSAYGVGQPRNMFISQVITHGLLNRQFKMSDGSQRRDFVFVKDVADAITTAVQTDAAAGHIINIAGGNGIALRTVAERAWELTGADPTNLKVGALPNSLDDGFDTEADISLAAKLLDWRPTVGILDEGVRAGTLEDMVIKMRDATGSAV